MKKNKKEKEPIVLGNEIKNISTNLKFHKTIYFTLLILANIALIIGLVFLIIYLNKWYIWLISALLLIACEVYLAFCFKNSNHCAEYKIYENYLVVKSLLFDANVEMEKILDVKIKTTIYDKLFKSKTSSLVVLYRGFTINKIILHFINEDINQVRKQIMETAIAFREKHHNELISK